VAPYRGSGKLGSSRAIPAKRVSKVYIEGKLRTRKWQGQDGQDRYTTEVVVDISGSCSCSTAAAGGQGQGPSYGTAPQPQGAPQPAAAVRPMPRRDPVRP
jgi:single-strand DNA-binding protein